MGTYICFMSIIFVYIHWQRVTIYKLSLTQNARFGRDFGKALQIDFHSFSAGAMVEIWFFICFQIESFIRFDRSWI